MLRRVLKETLIPILAVVTALLISVPVVLSATQGDWGKTLSAYGGLIDGALLKPHALTNTLVTTTPLILTGVAVALGFRAGLFNIGASGQFLAGAAAGTYVAYAVPMPPVIHLVAVLVVGFLGGALWGAIPGYLKAARGSHEVINTIALNFVAFFLTDWLIKGPMLEPASSNVRTPTILPTAVLPDFKLLLGPNDRLHLGFFIAVGAAVFIWWFLWKTTVGFELRTTGSNPNAARYAGIRPAVSTVLAMALSGGLAGLAGIIQVAGVDRFMPALFSSDFGFDAISVALLGRVHPVGVIPAAFLFGALRNGSDFMQIRSGGAVSKEVIFIVQGVVLLFIAAPAIVRRMYRLRIGKTALEGAPLTSGWGK